MKNVLFVCSANVDRSKTAEDCFSEVYKSCNFESAGTNHAICNEKGTNFINQELIEQAELIIVMEAKHRDWIYVNLDPKNTELIVLDIQDIYKYYSPDLIKILNDKCAHLLCS